MPGISRNNDLAATGHGCSPVAGCIATARTVFINGRRVLRPGDPLKPHFIPKLKPPPLCIPHAAMVNRGSRSVFAEGKRVARRGDSADFGAMIGASRNVFAG
jgi:uncharacterized Zn-binding protein involved in type VI secretion|tara:strand:- start:2446 stop:2751 length:306 start_codon:yes stop_codon:yes gene_type:complete